MTNNDYVLKYAKAVLSDEIIACKKIRQACQRELDDRKKIKDKDYPYYFDNELANKVLKVLEILPSPNGNNIKLALFQKFLVSSLYGWRTKKGNYRRYNKAFISMARKNGKSYLISSLAIVSLLFDDEPKRNRQILFVANSLSQALISFNMARSELNQLAQKSSSLRRRLTIRKKEIYDNLTDSFMIPLPSDAERLDGYNPTTAIIDEYHASRDDSVYNVLASGMGQQKNGLLAVISTRGFKRMAMYEHEQILTKILNKEIQDDRYFIALYEQDDKEDVVSLNTDLWQQSNPLLAVKAVSEVMLPKLINDVQSSIASDSLTPVLTKNFNLWSDINHDSFINLETWQKATIAKPNIDGKHVVFGVDLSKSNDLTSISWLVQLDNGTYYSDSHSFVANKDDIVAKGRRERVDYVSLARKGECDISQTDSGVIDYDVIYEWLIDFIKLHNLQVDAIAYDPYQMSYLIPRLEQNYQIVTIRQNNKTLSAPTKDFQDKILTKTIVHSDNTLLKRAVENGLLIFDSTNSCRLDKRSNSQKIDPLAALLDSYTYLFNSKLEEIKNSADNSYYENLKF